MRKKKPNSCCFLDVCREGENKLLSGYAKDLGLYMPEEIPVLGQEELQRLSGCSYTELVCKITRMFIDEAEIPTEELEGEVFYVGKCSLFLCVCMYLLFNIKRNLFESQARQIH